MTTQGVSSRWWKSFGISLIIALTFSIYLFARRGYYNIYIVNKVLGSTAAVVAGLTLIVGPLIHRWPRMSRLMEIRRELGLWALIYSLVHVITSTILQSKRFSWSWYLSEWIPISFGVVAIATWIYMTAISNGGAIAKLGADVWKRKLRIGGFVAYIAIFLHLTTMKYQGWINWWRGLVKASPELANPQYPPASIFVFLTILAILLFRLFEAVLSRSRTNPAK